MPVFEAPDADNAPLHMEGWDDDEVIYLQPHVTYSMEQRARGKAVQLPPGMTSDQLRAMPPDQVEALLVEHTDNGRIDQQLMLDMIQSWTLRRQPTRAQREKGERGDLVPLSREAIAQLPPAVGQFIREEIERRRDIVLPIDVVGPKGDDFRLPSPVPDPGLLPGPGGAAGVPDAIGSRSGRKDGLAARGDRPLAGRPA